MSALVYNNVPLSYYQPCVGVHVSRRWSITMSPSLSKEDTDDEGEGHQRDEAAGGGGGPTASTGTTSSPAATSAARGSAAEEEGAIFGEDDEDEVTARFAVD